MFEQLQIKFVFIFQILDRYLVFLRMQKVLFGSMNAHTKFGVSVFFFFFCNRQVEYNFKLQNMLHRILMF
jgi:hypothetical protein